ncbi:MAG: hypothetical protein K2N70_04750 [Helicobacter sp.]|nr:hypothetical protein [Helicobacter sp.]
MRKVFTIALLCAGLVFAADKPSEPKQVPSSEFAQLNKTFKTLKKKQDAKTRAIINVSALTIDANTDALYQFSIGNQQMFIATKLGQTTFAPAQKLGVISDDFGKTLCAYFGINKLDPTVPGAIPEARVGINSAGGWFYLTQYPKSELVIFDRSSSKRDILEKKTYEHVVFRFVLNTAGRAVIRRTSTEKYGTYNVTTPKPVPLNQWVYIQGRQDGLEHSVGWKTASDESVATQRFAPANVELDVFLMRSAFLTEGFASSKHDDILSKDLFVPNIPEAYGVYGLEKRPYPRNNGVDCTTIVYPAEYSILDMSDNTVTVQEFFWQPNMAMFALMNNYNAAEKDIGQKVSATFNVDTALIQELLNAANGTSTAFRFLPKINNGIVVDIANLDIYVDDSLNVVLFDLRQTPPAH